MRARPGGTRDRHPEMRGIGFAVKGGVAQKSTARLVLEPILIAIGLALVVRAGLFRIYVIPSTSMTPTLQVGDHIVVTPYHTAFTHQEPRPGDVVVFRSPQGKDELLIKRVVAAPGDLVELRSGRVVISGHTFPEPYLEKSNSTTGLIVPQIVPAGCYFVLGDNRANSFDSRNWGVLPGDLLLGRARLVLWSSGDAGTAPRVNATTRFDSRRTAEVIRPSRLFRPIR
jgi:signal peptidase I